MRKFYEVYGDLSNLPPTAAKLPWTHNSILVEKIDNNEFIETKNKVDSVDSSVEIPDGENDESKDIN